MLLSNSSGGSSEKEYIDSLFSAYTYTGNGTTQMINNGIDLAGKGGMVWTKSRGFAISHALYDTARGNVFLSSDSTAGNTSPSISGMSFSSSGYKLLGADGNLNNTSSNPYVSWTFRNAFNFSQVLSVTKSAGSNLVIDLSPYMTTVGMVKVKSLASGSWYVWHRSLPAGQLLIGETTAAATTLGHITVTGTTLTLVNGVIADGAYHIEAYAHDTSADGIIQCGSFTTDASGNATVNLGWEPQWLLTKANVSGDANGWLITDTIRGMAVNSSTGSMPVLKTNTSEAEDTSWDGIYRPTATGFSVVGTYQVNSTYIYLAIRRPNKPPTSGTQVYNAIARTGTDAVATITGVGFAPDLVMIGARSNNIGYGANWWDRLRGANSYLDSSRTAPENSAYTDELTAFGMSGVTLGASGNGVANNLPTPYINHFFRRAPGVFDQVCYTGTGVALSVPHNLGVVPELIIFKTRNATEGWFSAYNFGENTYDQTRIDVTSASNVGNAYASGNLLYAKPTASSISPDPLTWMNHAGTTVVAYLFATKAGITKVGSFTGNGTSQNIDCGFTTGARFFLCKRADSTGNWLVADSTRGIISSGDPTLYLNSTSAEVTGVDWVDNDASGIIVNQESTMNANVNGATYVYLAFA